MDTLIVTLLMLQNCPEGFPPLPSQPTAKLKGGTQRDNHFKEKPSPCDQIEEVWTGISGTALMSCFWPGAADQQATLCSPPPQILCFIIKQKNNNKKHPNVGMIATTSLLSQLVNRNVDLFQVRMESYGLPLRKVGKGLLETLRLIFSPVASRTCDLEAKQIKTKKPNMSESKFSSI